MKEISGGIYLDLNMFLAIFEFKEECESRIEMFCF
jgi:hypothetical protein